MHFNWVDWESLWRNQFLSRNKISLGKQGISQAGYVAWNEGAGWWKVNGHILAWSSHRSQLLLDPAEAEPRAWQPQQLVVFPRSRFNWGNGKLSCWSSLAHCCGSLSLCFNTDSSWISSFNLLVKGGHSTSWASWSWLDLAHRCGLASVYHKLLSSWYLQSTKGLFALQRWMCKVGLRVRTLTLGC